MAFQPRFRALNRYTCQLILEVLRERPQSFAEIHAHPGKFFTRPGVSQGLALLLKDQLVTVRREGRPRIYRLRADQLRKLEHYFAGLARDAQRKP